MNFLDCCKTNAVLSQLIEQYEIFNAIKTKIRTLIPPTMQDQFYVVGLENHLLIIYAGNSVIGNFLKLRKRNIVSLTTPWQVHEIQVKIKVQ